MDVSPPKPPVLPAPVAGPPAVSDAPAPSPGHSVQPSTPPAPAPIVPTPAPQAVPAASPKPAPTEQLTVKDAPLANLEVEENNTPSKAAPMSGAELAEATKELKGDEAAHNKAAATKKKAPPLGPKAPTAFIVTVVLFMIVLSGIAVAMYLTSKS